MEILESVLPRPKIGVYQLQAAISACHAESRSWEEVNWDEIVASYDLLHFLQPSPVERVNHAVALFFAKSPSEALKMLEDAFANSKLC